MNQYATTQNSGLLKDDYGDSTKIGDSLRRRRKKMAETKQLDKGEPLGLLGEIKKEEEGDEQG